MSGAFGLLYIYSLFEKQAFNGLLKVIGIQKSLSIIFIHKKIRGLSEFCSKIMTKVTKIVHDYLCE